MKFKFKTIHLLLLSVLLSFAMAEGVMRIYRHYRPSVWFRGNLLNDHFQSLYQYDAFLGWIPKPYISGNRWNVRIHHLADGIRSNGFSDPIKQPQAGGILALGDSFTYCDEVGDSETWPAQLESLLRKHGKKIPVWNAGVSSYGLDQAVLRGESLYAKYQPSVVILYFIEDDVTRCDYSVRHGVCKPYFEVQDGLLMLKNQPVPLRKYKQPNWIRKYFHWSAFLYALAVRLSPSEIAQGTMMDYELHDQQADENIEELILKRFVDVNRHAARRMVIVYEESHGEDAVKTMNLLNSLRASDVAVLNLDEKIEEHEQKVPGSTRIFSHVAWDHHKSEQGNAFTAQQIFLLLDSWQAPMNQ